MQPPPSPVAFARGVTLLGAVALIVGNMVGTSIYTLPANLAREVGPLGIVAWLVAALGYVFVALVYAHLGSLYPRTGGPYVFAREALGDFAGFQTVWAYWLSATIGNASIAAGVVGYLVHLSPPLAESRWLQFGAAQVFVWGLFLVNLIGVRTSARFQIAVLFLNVVPLLCVMLLALAHFEPQNLTPFAPNGWSALPVGIAMVVWAYSGIESATVPAEEVEAPTRTIRRGTMIGYALGTVVFFTTAVAVAGALPNNVIAGSTSPIALVAETTLGAWAGYSISAAAIIAGLGTLNGWILMAGRIPVSAARDGLFFESLARLHPRFHTPHVALFVGTLIASATLCLLLGRAGSAEENQSALLATFQFILNLAVLTTLLPHLYSAAAYLLIVRREPARYTRGERVRAHVIALVAFAFVLFTIYGVGAEVALWGFLAILAGTPLFVVFKTRTARRPG
jgi:basic amino acid/polyamine antiporter, APA family